ncbi:MAG TPA: twin-arginine translocase TatA/TatE family subunit [Nitrosopumilaceae archaeon]|nr:twin-arginine translocase TatA/TatE family subunit [Nitrosopumilaceae archaeon]
MYDFSLNILGSEWFIIAFVAIVLFFGSKRLPELSKKLGKAVGEYNKAKTMVQNEFQNVTSSYNINVQGPVEIERQKLEMIAKSLGVDFLNKSDDELRNIIASKMRKTDSDHKNTDNSGPPQQI